MLCFGVVYTITEMLMFFDHLKTSKIVSVTGGRIAGLFLLLNGLAACTNVFSGLSSDPGLKDSIALNKAEYGHAEYGMSIRPAVFQEGMLALQRGHGRSMIGKPYQIKGRWYHPEENPAYSKVGRASWYGSAFHGRLTANGETFDMNHLTAAHPTMPLPSYARVTNLKNGSSLVVRVNDRGPLAHNRIIDLSRRAAQLLGYQNSGVTDVKVEYVGPAPLHGQDDSYLLASFNPAAKGEGAAHAFLSYHDEKREEETTQKSVPLSGHSASPTPLLPQYGPQIGFKPALSSAFAEENRQHPASAAFAGILVPAGSAFDDMSAQGTYISVGTFDDMADAGQIAAGLRS